MSLYDLFRDEVAWRPKLGDPVYQGLSNLGPEQRIPARVIVATRAVAGDLVSQETIWTYPEHAVKPGDHLNGGPVSAVDAAKDRAGNVTYWISHVER